MKATLSFNEIKDIISKKTNNKVNLDFTYVDYRTVKVLYKPMAFLPAVNVDIMVAKADNSQLVLFYKANNAVDMIIKGLSNYLDNHIPKEIIELDASVQCVCINLDKIEQLQKPLEMIELKQVYFEKENVRAEIILKSN
ncbi:MAG: hypothetical protein IKW54_00195 [Bacteroidales bacterium]|nr:hypothetical protein [Bacteroidales bacterium]